MYVDIFQSFSNDLKKQSKKTIDKFNFEFLVCYQ